MMRYVLKFLRLFVYIIYRTFCVLMGFVWICMLCHIVDVIGTFLGHPGFWVNLGRTSLVLGAPVRFYYNTLLPKVPLVQTLYTLFVTHYFLITLGISIITGILGRISNSVARLEYNYLLRHGLLQNRVPIQQPVANNMQSQMDLLQAQQALIVQQQQAIMTQQAQQRAQDAEDKLIEMQAKLVVAEIEKQELQEELSKNQQK